MEKTNKRRYFVKCIHSFMIFCAILCVVLPIFWATDGYLIKCDEIGLDEHWNVSVHGKDYEDVILSKTQYGLCNKGDVLVMQRILPDELMCNPILRCYSVHSTVEAYIDDLLIYSYGMERKEKGELLGYGWHNIALPPDYMGKQLKIVFEVTENNAFEGLPAISISDGRSMMQREFALSKYSLTISLFLVLFGILGMFFSLVMHVRSNGFLNIFCIMLFSFTVGIWTLCNSDLILFFTTDLKVKVYLEYCSFYFLAIPLLLYFAEYVKGEKCPLIFRRLYSILLLVESAFFACVMFLQANNRVHFPTFVSGQHVIFLLTIIFIFALCIMDYRVTKHAQKGLLFGFILAGLLAMWELFSYNFSKYMTGFSDNKYNSTVGIAALIVVLALFFDFSSKVMVNLQKEAQQSLLEKMAYMDELTGLSNRRRCDEAMLDMDKKDIPYAIISLDMNLLKYINDTYGHEFGDAALREFSVVLQGIFDDTDIIGRMGGDEFFVLMPNATKRLVEEKLQLLTKAMNEHEIKNTSVVLSAAYGYAFGTERENSHAVYSLADERMYENKRLSKMGRDK